MLDHRSPTDRLSERAVASGGLAAATTIPREVLFQALAEMTMNMIVIVDLQGRIIYTNPQIEVLLGYTPSEVIGKSLECLVPRRFRSLHVRFRQQYMIDLPSRLMGDGHESYALRKDGLEVPVDITLAPLQLGSDLFAMALVKDLTPYKKVLQELAIREAELRANQELTTLKDRLLSVISHELKTPLSIIMGHAELLEEKYPQDREMLLPLMDSVWRISDKISAILDYQALISGNLPIYKSRTSIREVLENTRMRMDEAFRTKNVTLNLEIPANLPCVWTDYHRATEMLLELLRNAHKFTPPGGKVIVRVLEQEHGLRVEIQDTGPGIKKAEQKKIWEAFTQSDVSNTRLNGGIGMGLALVRALAKELDCSIEFRSAYRRGALFALTYPLALESLASPLQGSASRPLAARAAQSSPNRSRSEREKG